MDLGRFTRRLGPLPIYVWALLIVGAGAAVLYFTRGSSASGPAVDSTSNDATTQADDYASDSSGTNAQDSSSIGLGSLGSTPIHVVIDTPIPSLYPQTPPPPAKPKPSSPPPATPVGGPTTPPPTTKPKPGYIWAWSKAAQKWYQKRIGSGS